MIKNCVIFMDCIGGETSKYLLINKKFKNDFLIKVIWLNDYVSKGQPKFNITALSNEHIIAIKNAGTLILQLIETDRGF